MNYIMYDIPFSRTLKQAYKMKSYVYNSLLPIYLGKETLPIVCDPALSQLTFTEAPPKLESRNSVLPHLNV